MIKPNDDDVLSFSGDIQGWDLAAGKVNAVLGEIERTAAEHRDGGQLAAILIREGADCEYLSVNGGGWRKGKVKLKMVFEFIPDTPDSPLDDLR